MYFERTREYIRRGYQAKAVAGEEVPLINNKSTGKIMSVFCFILSLASFMVLSAGIIYLMMISDRILEQYGETTGIVLEINKSIQRICYYEYLVNVSMFNVIINYVSDTPCYAYTKYSLGEDISITYNKITNETWLSDSFDPLLNSLYIKLLRVLIGGFIFSTLLFCCCFINILFRVPDMRESNV